MNLNLKFPNNLFYDGLKLMEAQSRETDDLQRAWAYQKAALAIRNHPEVLPNGKAAQALQGIGPSIAQRLDEMLLNYHGTCGLHSQPPSSTRTAWSL